MDSQGDDRQPPQTTSNQAASDIIDGDRGHVNDTLDRIALNIDSGRATNDWSSLWPVPTCLIAYGIHRYYRNYRPRRFPTLTGLKLPEIYISFAVSLSLADYVWHREKEVLADREMLTIELAGQRARAFLLHPGFKRDLESLKVPEELSEVLRRIREVRYHEAGLLPKIGWWHNHVWSDELSWNKWASMLLLSSRGSKDMELRDWDVCITHIANTTDRTPYGLYVGLPFISTIPLRAFALRVGMPLLLRSANGLQRLLLAAYLYCDPIRSWQHWTWLNKLENKGTVIEMLSKGINGAVEKDIEDCLRTGALPASRWF